MHETQPVRYMQIGTRLHHQYVNERVTSSGDF